MVRVLIADPSNLFATLLAEQMGKDFDVRTCGTGYEALDHLASFHPEIVILDVSLADESGVTVLHTLNSAADIPYIIALSYMTNERALIHLSQYDITCVLPKPCTVELVMEHVRSIAFRLDNPLGSERPLRNEIDSLLLALGFRMGMNRYNCVAYAVLVRYNNPECAMKELYIDVARKCGGTAQSVEKAIRDGINRAYKRGNPSTWAYYFQVPREKGKPCKGNSTFFAGLIACLNKKKRTNSHTEPHIK